MQPMKYRYSRILTADDWGLSPAANEGILELVEKGVINNVALMANMPFLTHRLDTLIALQDRCHMTLHFNIIDGFPLSPNPKSLISNKDGKFHNLKTQILKSFALRLDPTEVAAEFESQLTCILNLGVDVSRINAHQHAHLLPRVMHAIMPIALQHHIRIIRLPLDIDLWFSSKFFLSILSHYNCCFNSKYHAYFERCYYHLSKDLRSKEHFLRKLNRYDHCEFLFHPAYKLDFDEFGVTDPYRAPRIHEYTILKSSEQEVNRILRS